MTDRCPLISADALIDDDNGEIAIIDATWCLGDQKGFDIYQQGHIPGAHFFDIDAIADAPSDLPHILPGPDVFADAVAPMIGGRKSIVVYDQSPLRSAARVWWTMKVMGYTDVRVLDGGLDAYRAAGGVPSTKPPEPNRGHAVVPERLQDDLVVDFWQLHQWLDDESVLVVDARSAGRFAGVDPEPRPGLRSGAMPGSANVPFTDLYEPTGRLLGKAELAQRFAPLELERYRRIVATCGSGVTACSLLLALTQLGFDNLTLYDGAWAEWASRSDLIVTKSD